MPMTDFEKIHHGLNFLEIVTFNIEFDKPHWYIVTLMEQFGLNVYTATLVDFMMQVCVGATMCTLPLSGVENTRIS